MLDSAASGISHIFIYNQLCQPGNIEFPYFYDRNCHNNNIYSNIFILVQSRSSLLILAEQIIMIRIKKTRELL